MTFEIRQIQEQLSPHAGKLGNLGIGSGAKTKDSGKLGARSAATRYTVVSVNHVTGKFDLIVPPVHYVPEASGKKSRYTWICRSPEN